MPIFLKHRSLLTFCFYLSHAHCHELLLSYWTTCSFIHLPFFLICAFWSYWPSWLIFILWPPVRSSLPARILLGSWRSGPPCTSKPLCVPFTALVMPHCLWTHVSILLDQEPLGRDLFVFLSLQDSLSHKIWVRSEYLLIEWVKEWVRTKTRRKWVPPLGDASCWTLGMSACQWVCSALNYLTCYCQFWWSFSTSISAMSPVLRYRKRHE